MHDPTRDPARPRGEDGTATPQPPSDATVRLITDDIRQMTDEAETLLRTIAPFAERVGAVIAGVDDLVAGLTDAEEDDLRASTGYDRLMRLCDQIVGHAMASADSVSSGATAPPWYDALMERRQARWEAA